MKYIADLIKRLFNPKATISPKDLSGMGLKQLATILAQGDSKLSVYTEEFIKSARQVTPEGFLQDLQNKGANQILIDPGFGLGKTVKQNYALLDGLPDFMELKLPILVGISRKSMIYKQLKTTPEKALNGTSVIHTMALERGAQILRVHDVKEALECITLWSACSSWDD